MPNEFEKDINEQIDKRREKILRTEYSIEFDEKRKNSMILGFYEYGSIFHNTQNGFTDSVGSAKKCIEKYKETGNKKYLIDAANFAMMEYMHSQHINAHEDRGDSPESATIREVPQDG